MGVSTLLGRQKSSPLWTDTADIDRPALPKKSARKPFVCRSGYYQYSRMPFGLTNPSAIFQGALDMISFKFKWQTFLVYIDYIFIYSKTVEEHIRHVDETFTAFREAGVILKVNKCHFFRDSVEYLVLIFKQGRLEIDCAHTSSLR